MYSQAVHSFNALALRDQALSRVYGGENAGRSFTLSSKA